jgi:Phage tail lysozyme
MGLIAPAIIVIGGAATWQFSSFGEAPASAHVSTVIGRPVGAKAGPAGSRVKATAASAARLPIAGVKHHVSGATPTAAATHAPAVKRAAATTSALRCAGTSGMLPANYAAIVDYLTAHGYTALAAAGIAGNIYQESRGNPESVGTGGGGLIGWTPLPAGFVTGDVEADLQTQLAALLTYNNQWARYIPALNAASNATEAAYIYMTYFERPGIPAAYNREGAADAVAQACGIA